LLGCFEGGGGTDSDEEGGAMVAVAMAMVAMRRGVRVIMMSGDDR